MKSTLVVICGVAALAAVGCQSSTYSPPEFEVKESAYSRYHDVSGAQVQVLLEGGTRPCTRPENSAAPLLKAPTGERHVKITAGPNVYEDTYNFEPGESYTFLIYGDPEDPQLATWSGDTREIEEGAMMKVKNLMDRDVEINVNGKSFTASADSLSDEFSISPNSTQATCVIDGVELSGDFANNKNGSSYLIVVHDSGGEPKMQVLLSSMSLSVEGLSGASAIGG